MTEFEPNGVGTLLIVEPELVCKRIVGSQAGASSLMMIILLGSAMVTVSTALVSFQVQTAKRGAEAREKRISKTSLSSISQYVEMAIRSRWCLKSDLSRELTCNPGLRIAPGAGSTERISLSRDTLAHLKTKGVIPPNTVLPAILPTPEDYNYLFGSIPSSCGPTDGLAVAPSHPLKLILDELKNDYKCIKWAVRRKCSAVPVVAGGSAVSTTDCAVADLLRDPIGDETKISFYMELVPKDSQFFPVNTKVEELFAVIPRRVNSYAAIFKGDIAAYSAYGGHPTYQEMASASMIRGLDSIIRFPKQASGVLKGVIFHGPVLTNGDLVVPPIPVPSSTQKAKVTFNDVVYLSSGKVVTFANGQKIPVAPTDPTLTLANSNGFGGLRKGSLQDSLKDEGLDCLLPNSFPANLVIPDGSPAATHFPSQCLAGQPFSRLAAFIKAQTLGEAENTKLSALAVKRLNGATAVASSWAGTAPTPPAEIAANTATQSLLLGLTDRNYFKGQKINTSTNRIVVPSPSPSGTPENQLRPFFFANPTNQATIATNTSVAFPANAGQVWGTSPPTGAAAEQPWASFSPPAVFDNDDPRQPLTRNRPILRAILAGKINNIDNGRFSSLLELGMGFRDSFTIPLHPWNPQMALANSSPWDAQAATGNGSCESSSGNCVQYLIRPQSQCNSGGDTLEDRYDELRCFARELFQKSNALITSRDALSARMNPATALNGLISSCNDELNQLKSCCQDPNDDCGLKNDPTGNPNLEMEILALQGCAVPNSDPPAPVNLPSSITEEIDDCDNRREDFLEAFAAFRDFNAGNIPERPSGGNPDPWQAERVDLENKINEMRAFVSTSGLSTSGPGSNPCPSNLNSLPSGRVTCATALYTRWNSPTGIRENLNRRMRPLYDLFRRAPGYEESSLASYPVAELGETAPPVVTRADPPQLQLDSRPIAHRHPLTGKNGNTESIRYYWRSDQVRLDVQIRNLEYLDWDLANQDGALQLEIEAFDAASSESNLAPGNVGQARPISSWGPNCSHSRSNENNFCESDFNSGDLGRRVFAKSPNILRFQRPEFQSNWASGFDFATIQNLWAQQLPYSNLKINPTAAFSAASRPLSRLVRSCIDDELPPEQTSATQGTIQTTWDDMRCHRNNISGVVYPNANMLLSSSTNKRFNVGLAWQPDSTSANATLVGAINFMGDTAGDDLMATATGTSAYDPLELLMYDQKVLAGDSGQVELSESFAAHAARISWDFNRPKEMNPFAFVEEVAPNVLFGHTPQSADTVLNNRVSLPKTAYNASNVFNPAIKIWAARGTEKTYHAFSWMRRCVVLSDVQTLVGFFGCDRLEIEPRATPLDLIGTFIIGQLDLPESLPHDIHFYNLDHPVAAQKLRNGDFFKTSPTSGSPQACPKAYGRISVPGVLGMTDPQQQTYKSCEASWIRGMAVPFNWTVVDPECGIDPNNQWQCQTPNWFRRFRLLRLGSRSSL